MSCTCKVEYQCTGDQECGNSSLPGYFGAYVALHSMDCPDIQAFVLAAREECAKVLEGQLASAKAELKETVLYFELEMKKMSAINEAGGRQLAAVKRVADHQTEQVVDYSDQVRRETWERAIRLTCPMCRDGESIGYGNLHIGMAYCTATPLRRELKGLG